MSLRSWSKRFIPLSPSGVFKGGKGGIIIAIAPMGIYVFVGWATRFLRKDFQDKTTIGCPPFPVVEMNPVQNSDRTNGNLCVCRVGNQSLTQGFSR